MNVNLVKTTTLLSARLCCSSIKSLRLHNQKIGYNALQRRNFSKRDIEPSENYVSNPPGIQMHPPSVLARSLLELRKSGSFSTVTVDPEDNQLKLYGTPGTPYVLLQTTATPYPVFAFRSTQKHAQHIQQSPNASLLLFPLTPRHIVPTKFGLWMVNFSGKVNLLDNPLREEAKQKFCTVHQGIQEILETENDDFHYYSFKPLKILFREREKTTEISIEEFESSQVDSVIKDSANLMNKLNQDHLESLLYLIQEYANFEASEVFVFSIDKFGFSLVAKKKSSEEWTEVRVPFPFVMSDIEECEDSLMPALSKIKDEYTKDKIF